MSIEQKKIIIDLSNIRARKYHDDNKESNHMVVSESCITSKYPNQIQPY